jgi:L-lactate dehydrogenase complex protein LldG
MERGRFLQEVRRHLRNVEAPPLPRTLPPTPASGDGRPLPQRFAEELSSVGVVPATGVAEAVAGLARDAAAATAVVSPDVGPLAAEVERGLRAAGTEVLAPAGAEAWREAAARADVGVTGGLAAVASSGSVLMHSGVHTSRLASLLPPAHIAVVPVERLVPGFEELLRDLPEHLEGSSGGVLVTGPSRTADIEMTLVRGVHGPRDVHVLLVEGSPEPGQPPVNSSTSSPTASGRSQISP